MARFTFEYEAVLRQRVRAEREQQARLGELERARLGLEEQIRGYQQSIERERGELSGLLRRERGAPGAVDLRGARLQANASLSCIAMAQRAVIKLSGVHKKIDAERLKLIELAAARRAMETLKERRYQAWKREMSKREDAAIDEMAVMGFGRKGSAAGE